MMKIILLLIKLRYLSLKKISLVFFIVSINLLLSSPKDTLQVEMREVSVSADRINSNNFVKYNLHSFISFAEIDKFQPRLLSEVINNYSGIFIKDYGGLGGLKTVSLRGMNTNQNIIMINGIKLNSSQNMIVDLSKISPNTYKSIEVIKGGNSAIFGAGAMGGVINLINDVIDTSIYASIDYGSFNDFITSLGYEDNNSNIKSSGNISYLSSEGNYKFKIDNNEFTRQNSDFTQLSINELIETKCYDYNVSLIVNYSQSLQGVPGPVIGDKIINYSNSRLKENYGFGIIKIDKQVSPNSNISLSTNFNRRITDFKDKDFLGVNGEFNSKYLNDDFSSSLSFVSFEKNKMFKINIEFNKAYLEADNGISNKIKNYERNNIALSSNYETNVLKNNSFDLNGFLGFRYDYFSDIQSSPSGFLGTVLNFKFLPINLKTNISYNFRSPSFNELYYFNFGNENLEPEKAISYNLGLTYFQENFKIELNGFFNYVNDQIISIPQNPIYWTTKNIQRVDVTGFEINTETNLFNNLIYGNFNFTFTKSLDKSSNSLNYNELLVYSPEIISNLIIFYSDNSKNIGFTFNYTGESFYLPDNEEEFKIPAHLIINFFAKYKIKLLYYLVTFNFNIRNLTNESYYIIKSYPMPGISFRGGLNVKI